ncbi:uncharacterized protein LOC131148898 isoform X2 [Malania oleifera]|uniref:uncharacterized protein LOC131148898 isoform X2 n=1 Tax=Malania oleifera TaxID=397392 RepID=UPI0025AE3269|nr:uncharacterized protein LOC131148898 isoform X2 [Malania oleifera]
MSMTSFICSSPCSWFSAPLYFAPNCRAPTAVNLNAGIKGLGRPMVWLQLSFRRSSTAIVTPSFLSISAALQGPLDLTEDNVKQVLADARLELAQIFDTSVGITGQAELAELDGPFVKISLRGRFWHRRTLVLARLGSYLKSRIPVSDVLIFIFLFISVEDQLSKVCRFPPL